MKHPTKVLVTNVFTILWYLRGIITVLYVFFALLPTNIFLRINSFSVDDIVVWQKATIDSIRTAYMDLWGYAIEEINYITGNNYQSVYTNTREINTEKSIKHITREINYIHTKPWQYELYLNIYHNLWYWIWKITRLHTFYHVR